MELHSDNVLVKYVHIGNLLGSCAVNVIHVFHELHSTEYIFQVEGPGNSSVVLIGIPEARAFCLLVDEVVNFSLSEGFTILAIGAALLPILAGDMFAEEASRSDVSTAHFIK